MTGPIAHRRRNRGQLFYFLPDAQALFQPHPDGLLLDTNTDSLEWFASWLAQLHFDFTVLEPEGLKDALHERAARLVAACGIN